MSVTLQTVIACCNQLWPENTAEDWDRVGLIAGVPGEPVTKVALALDANLQNANSALAAGAQLLITHHPLLLRGVHSVAATNYKGEVLTRLIRAGVALYAAHTNADITPDGVSDIIAQRLGLRDIRPLVAGADPATGIGRTGVLADPLPLKKFAQKAAEVFPATVSGLRVAGDKNRLVQRVALCGGAGDSLLTNPQVLAADVYITSDLRHHPAQEFLEGSAVPALIDVAHWAAESLWLEVAAKQLQELLPQVEFIVCDSSSDPWDFSVGALQKRA